MSAESYIKDSQNLIQKTKDLKIPVNHTLITADFVALYSNIDHEDCLYRLTDFFKDKLQNFKHIKIEGFHSILKLVLENNFFKYDKLFFKQIKGIAMGSICGPSKGNLFVSIYEKKWLTIHRPFIYFRFIDDLFMVLKDILILESLKNSFGSLNLTFEMGKSVKYLDLEISIDKLTSYLDFSMYFKPTNTFSYLHIESNHPKYIFNNLVKSLLIRARRICSKINNFIYFASTISKQLISRGYNKNLIDKIFTMVAKLDRDFLLIYKPKKNIDFNNTFIIKNKYDCNILNFKEIANKAFISFKKENLKFKDHKLMVINTMQNNISSLLVNDFKFPQLRNFFLKNVKI